MISQDEIMHNKEEYISLIRSITREGANIEELIRFLEESDFFYAPASTKYHNAMEGGLCKHSLNVYYNYMNLIKLFNQLPDVCYDENTIKIITLGHDISKINQYERCSSNVKVYTPSGKSKDALGAFNWETTVGWKKRDSNNRFVFGSHEATSEFILRQYIPLTVDESSAILHHMGGMAWDSAKDNLGEVFNRYPVALLLYMSDMISTYITEGN